MREGTVPAAVVAAAVVAFVGYVSFEGSSHAVDFAVTGAEAAVVPAGDPRVPAEWRRRAPAAQVLLVDVSWQAVESIGGGSYAVLVTTPRRWTHLGCRPECEWADDEGVRVFARTLARRTYPLGASFDAEEFGAVRVAYRSPRRGPGPEVSDGFVPTAWLVQTDGDNVLGADQIPLS